MKSGELERMRISAMRTRDEERIEQNKLEGTEMRAAEKTQRKAEVEFKRLKNEAEEKMGIKRKVMSDADMLEWVELNKQLQINRETGKPYVETYSDKFKRKFGENPLVPVGEH